MRCESELAELLTVVNDEAVSEFTSRANSTKGAFLVPSSDVDAVIHSSKEEKSEKSEVPGCKTVASCDGDIEEFSLIDPAKMSSKSVRIDERSLPISPMVLRPVVSPYRAGRGSMIGGGEGNVGGEDHLGYIPKHTYALHTRLKIYELEEAVKAMRRAVETMDISNQEYFLKVRALCDN